jgi:cohesin complex subunit SA-1/2
VEEVIANKEELEEVENEEQNLEEEEEEENDNEEEENEEQEEARVEKRMEETTSRKKDGKKIPPIQVGCEFAGDTGLLLASREGRESIDRVSKEWVVRYMKNRGDACAEAATFLLQACGVISMAFSASDIEQSGSDELKNRVEECIKDSGLENILGGRGGKHFKQDYKEMWDKIIRELGKSGTFDMFVVEKIVELTIALSTSAVREVRRIATLTVGQISTSLLFLAAQMHDVREKALDQAKTAEGKKKGKQLEAFKAQADTASSFLQETLSFVDSIFQSVFTTRFRDIDVEIRSIIVQNLGSWMVLYPTVFLSSTYLKYLAWALSDKDALVRYSAIVAIRSVYEDENNALQLKDFTNRFVDRMEELMLDKDDYVAVAGTELVTLLVHGNHLGSERCRNVFDLLSDPSERLRSAAAELASGMIKRLGKDVMTESGGLAALKKKTGRGGQSKAVSKAAENELAGVLSILHTLSEGYQNEFLPEQIVFFVISSLSDKLGCLTNWTLMVDWLQRDVASQLFGERAVRDLGMSLLCAIRASQSLPSTKLQQTKERRNAKAKAKQEMTLLLQKEIQNLLEKFQSDSTMVSLIARMIPFMKLDLFSLKRQEPGFTKMLDKVRDVMFRHTEHECVLSCGKALSWCMIEGKSNTRDLARATFVKAEVEASADLQKTVELIQQLGQEEVASLTQRYLNSSGAEEPEALFTIKRSMVHVSCLLESHPSSFSIGCELQQHLNMLLSLVSDGCHLPAKIVFDAERSLLLILLSGIASIDSEHEDLDKISSIKDTVSDLFCSIHTMIDTARSKGWLDIAAHSAAVMSDLFTLFNVENLPNHLKDLAYSPLDEDIDIFWNGIEPAICNPSLLGGLDASDDQLAPSALDMTIRIASLDGMRQYKQLGAKILSYWEHPSLSPETSNKFKDLVKKLRQIESFSLPDVYLHAMRISYNRYCNEALSFPEEEKETLCEKAIEPFLLLSHKIANSQASLNAPQSTLSYISEKAALWALEETPRNLEFLQGGSYFVVKVKGTEAKSILEAIESAGQAAGAPPDSGDDMGDWELYYEYCDVLRMQTQKQTNKGVLKRSSPKETPKQSRRISFAIDDDFEANVDVKSADRRRSNRFDRAMSPNYQETLTDDVDIMDRDVVSQMSQ